MLEDTKRTLIALCSILTVLTVIIIFVLIRKSKSLTVKQQFCQNLPDRRECIFPEYYDSVIEFNTSSTCRRQNTFADLRQSKSFYDRIPTQIPVNAALIHDNALLGETDFTYLSLK
ncbi:unnamed protein product [Onchocerca flexuosa]|uniref:Transmembrane protein n=1 Tax=Onchocerca flexuosa TaxID=387005 RepID=A0A183HP63_9BILA|nr:unnamed protein product [Onchocerca flexuosa]